MKNYLFLLLFANSLSLNPDVIHKKEDNFNLTNQIIAQNSQKKRISSSNRQYLVSYDGNRFYFEDANGNKIIPTNPENRNLLMDLANCYLTDEKVKSIGVNNLISDVNNLESLVSRAATKNISSIAYSVWESKTDPFSLLNKIFQIGNSLEIDPRFYVTVLTGNISSSLGKKQKEAIYLINTHPNLDAFVYGRIRMLLEDSEPYIEPSYTFLRNSLISPNYKLDNEEKDKLLAMEPYERRQYLITKIKSTPEFAVFSNTVQAKQRTWENLRGKASSVIY